MARNVVRRIMLGSVEYRLVRVTCGKTNCGRCPHGPYWYATGLTKEGRKWIKYLGKKEPGAVAAAEAAAQRERLGL